MKVQIVIFDGFDELDAIAPYEVLHSAAQRGADLSVELVSLTLVPEIEAAHGLRLRPQGQLDLAFAPDLLIVPGGGWNNRAVRGTYAEVQRGELPRAIARLHAAGTVMASVCTGGMLLVAAGVTQNRPATTHHEAIEDMKASGTEVVEARVVDDGNLITAGGVTSGLDLALWLVERYCGTAVASAVATELEYQRCDSLWRRPL